MPPVLQSLSLTAYRGISDLVLSGLAPVSLIVGANNAGKSSFLEAVDALVFTRVSIVLDAVGIVLDSDDEPHAFLRALIAPAAPPAPIPVSSPGASP